MKVIDMARNGKTAADGEAVHRGDEVLRGDGADLVERGILAANTAFSHALNASRAAVEWQTRLHRLQTKRLGEWSQALGTAVKESEQASDVPGLMTVATHLHEKQLGLAMQQFAEGTALWMDNEMQWLHRWRADAVAWAAKLLPGVAPWTLEGDGFATEEGGGDASPLAQLGQLQRQWLAMTQSWIQATARAANPTIAGSR